MDREKIISNLPNDVAQLYRNLNQLRTSLRDEFKTQFNRSLPMGDELFDRWERAQYLGFAKSSSIYESSYVLGDVEVGEKTWIGPFVMLDGSGGLRIGSYCMISSGVHIYTHDTVKWSLTAGQVEAERASVKIEDCCYIGSQAMIIKGVEIGHHTVVGACSFVNKSIPANSIAVGVPAKVIGRTIIDGDNVKMEYF
ncbi:MAG: acyltransferase [candidate division Zixibacteria bacterium]|nr:acyltransferase [candidate division Zixibacteria bacterium]